MSLLWIQRGVFWPLIFIYFLMNGVSQAETPSCAERYALLNYQQDAAAPLKLTPLLRTEAGFLIDLSEYAPGDSQIFDVLLEIPTHFAFDHLVKTLAISQDPNEITKTLKTHLAQNPGKPISLKEVGPAVMREKTNSSSVEDGPNCWNATLAWYFPNTPQEYTKPEEIETLLQTRFQKLPPKAQLKYGDLIALRRTHYGSDYILHTAVYLGGGIAWHKASSSKKEPYVFSTLKNILQNYEQTLSQGGVYHTIYRLHQPL